MASYMRNPMFGQDNSYDQGWDYGTGWSDYSSQPSSVGYTSGPEGSGTTASWETIVAGGLGLATSIINATAGPQPMDAGYVPQTYAPPLATVPSVAPGSLAATGSINSTVLLAGGLGLAALFLFRKK